MIMLGPSAPSDRTGTLPQTVRRDFSAVGYDEAMRRAREIVPILRERAERTEDARQLIRDNEQLLHETGLFRFHQPKAFGGMELDFVAVVDVPAELARGCPSTAWNVGNVACHHWILGYYDPETQREVWEANPDALIASSIALAAGRGRKVEGGFVVNGRWPFSSAVDNSEWNMLAVSVYDGDGKAPVDWRLCLVPKSDYEIIDTWYAMGMGGTGSKDVAVSELFVPERRALPRRLRASGSRAQRGRALPRSDRGRLQPSAGAGGARRRRGRLRAVSRRHGQARRHLHGRPRCGFPGGADQGRTRALPDRLGALLPAPVGHCAPGRRGAQRGPGSGDETALPRLYGFRREPGARGGRDPVVVLRRPGPLYQRPAAAAPARRPCHQPALLVQLRHRRRGLWIAGARRPLRQSDHVTVGRNNGARNRAKRIAPMSSELADYADANPPYGLRAARPRP